MPTSEHFYRNVIFLFTIYYVYFLKITSVNDLSPTSYYCLINFLKALKNFIDYVIDLTNGLNDELLFKNPNQNQKQFLYMILVGFV